MHCTRILLGKRNTNKFVRSEEGGWRGGLLEINNFDDIVPVDYGLQFKLNALFHFFLFFSSFSVPINRV